MDILSELFYITKTDSILNGIIPISDEKASIVSIGNVYKKGTSNTGKINITGNVTFDIASGVNFISFRYKSNSLYIGDDSFEFVINHSDGTKSFQVINIAVRQRFDNVETKYIYMETYFDKDKETSAIDILSKFTLEKNVVPTKVTVCSSNKEFNTEKYTLIHNRFKTDNFIQLPVHKTLLSTSAKVSKSYAPIGDISALKSILISLTRNNGYNGDEYCIINFTDFVDLTTGDDLKLEEVVNITFHLREVNEKYDKIPPPIVVPFPTFKEPSFVNSTIEYPVAPENISSNLSKSSNTGDLLYNTRAHKEFDDVGNKTIRLGKKVPDGAVNLGYYYNATSSLEDTVSIVETNTNTVTLHYVEDWVHKLGLATNEERHFPEYIEFDGEEGTELEGYWGILYRDYIMWEEEPIIDQEPENAIHYERYFGLSKKKVPLTKKFKKGEKSGVLELVHSIFTPIEFRKTSEHLIEDGVRRWDCKAKYEGIIKNNKVRYNGSAKYSGVVAKKDGMSNIDPELPKEIIMYPDENGLLHKLNGEILIDDDLFYITDKFKEDTPLYYKHKLKYKIYDNIGPDEYGSYNAENIKLVSENHTPINENKFKFKVDVKPTEYKNIYNAFVYTSFIPSLENPIYVMYDGLPEEAYMSQSTTSQFDVKVGILEKLSVIPAYDTDEYIVDVNQGLTMQSTIVVKDYEVIDDLRDKIKIEYIISAEGFSTPPITTNVINKKYAIYNELPNFKGKDMIASLKNINGYMTAKDMLLSYMSENDKKKITSNSIFEVKFNVANSETLYNKDKVILYTDPDGKGLIYVRTYCDTGMPDTSNPKKNRVLDTNSLYYSDGGKIHKGFSVKCRNINQIVISAPAESDPLKGWYPKVRYSYFNKVYERIDNTIQLIYSIPEYNTQIFGAYGKPYIDVKDEKPRYIGASTVKVKKTPMYVKINSLGEPINISAHKVLADGSIKNLNVKSFNFKHGLVEFVDQLSTNDDIYISYTYEEQYMHYKGYYHNFDPDTRLLDLNLNPSVYSTFIDTRNEIFERKNTYELFNRTIHFFLRPMRIINKLTGEVDEDNMFTLYHKFDSQDALGPFDLHIGRVFVRHHASLQSTKIIDTRSRGGGVIEELKDDIRRELEPESDYYLDIGTLDGKPYQENSVIVVRIDNRVLRVNGGRFSEEEVKFLVQKWASYGTYPIIEYVDVINQNDMPQNTMIVKKHISNQIDFNPFFKIDIVNQ